MSHATNARVIALATEARAAFHPLVKDGKDVCRDGVRVMVYDRETAPSWLPDLCQDAHNGSETLPDDWRFSFIVETLDALADLTPRDGFGDALAAFAEADVYNADRLAWLASNLTRVGYCDEAIAEGMCPEVDGVSFTLLDAVGVGQASERAEVFNSVLGSLQEIAEAQPDDDDDDDDETDDEEEGA